MDESRARFPCLLLVTSALLAGCGSDGVFVGSPAVGDLRGQWVLTNQGLEAYDCHGEGSGPDDFPWCDQLELQLPIVSSCGEVCDEIGLCVTIEDGEQPTATGHVLWYGDPVVYQGIPLLSPRGWSNVVFFVDGDELVIRPVDANYPGGMFSGGTRCSALGEWRGRAIPRTPAPGPQPAN